METTKTPVRLNGLARRLVNDNLLDENDALLAQQDAKESKQTFVSFLVKNELVASQDIALAASQEFGVPLFDLSAMSIEAIPKNLVKEGLIREHNALPLFQRGTRLYVAVSDPTNLQAMDVFQFNTSFMHNCPIF